MATVTVNPDVLVWARKTANLTHAEAAAKVGIRDTKTMAAAERLAALEQGEGAPTRSILVKMAKSYHRPLLTFYLPTPPPLGERGTDFRQPVGASPVLESGVDALVRDVRSRQSMVRATLIAEDEAAPLEFIGALGKRADPAAAHKLLRQLLPADLNICYYNGQNPGSAFRLLRSHVEQMGIFVMLKGNLGSWHTKIEPRTFRGFAIADPIAPFVVINEYDSQAAWSFTLLHELIHLLLGRTGISGSETEHHREERFCNRIAGEWLLPGQALESLNFNQRSDICNQVTSFARNHNVSGAMVAYRLLQVGRINQNTYNKLHSVFLELWKQHQNDRKEKEKTRKGGPNPHRIRAHRLGPALLQFCQRMMNADALSTAKVGRILGIQPSRVGKFFQFQG